MSSLLESNDSLGCLVGGSSTVCIGMKPAVNSGRVLPERAGDHHSSKTSAKSLPELPSWTVMPYSEHSPSSSLSSASETENHLPNDNYHSLTTTAEVAHHVQADTTSGKKMKRVHFACVSSSPPPPPAAVSWQPVTSTCDADLATTTTTTTTSPMKVVESSLTSALSGAFLANALRPASPDLPSAPPPAVIRRQYKQQQRALAMARPSFEYRLRRRVITEEDEQLGTEEARVMRGTQKRDSGQAALLMNLRFVRQRVASATEEEKKREGRMTECCRSAQTGGFADRLEGWFGARGVVGSGGGRKPRMNQQYLAKSASEGSSSRGDETRLGKRKRVDGGSVA